ncbi:MAG: PD-(D/E)XK nuclease family protein, partial [Salinivirgaceae bacterium]|nr:PD-(D/E)XK nuclease family protein [Salinivirgaceae bacterium]
LRSDIVFNAGQPLEIAKNGYTMQQLMAYVVDDRPFDRISGISPSDIVTYQRCQVQFYFSKVLNLKTEDDVEENIDVRRFGNIFHNAMHKIYKGFVGKTVVGSDIRGLSDDFVEAKIAEAFAEEMFPFDETRQKSIADGHRKLADELNGNNLIVHNVIRKYVKAQMNYDAQTADKKPIKFVGLEKRSFMSFPIDIGGEKLKIKLKGVIDRIDCVSDELRVIDYKTGSNDVVCNSIDDVFDAAKIKDYKGILQTLIYCMMFDSEDPTHETLMPYLFKTVDLSQKSDFKVRSKNDEFSEGNYRRVEQKVKSFVTDTLSDIFNQDKPFVQTADEKNCQHCNFFYFCNKQSKSNDY